MINYLLFIIAFNLLFTTSLFGQETTFQQPVIGEISLSGNFGELRGTHLHAGIDFRTGGKEGLPVKCFKDGMLVRVVVSPVGYGNALYIEHNDGTTSVYAHLQRFNNQLALKTRSAQYRRSSFAVDLNVKDQRIQLKQGDIIGYSGNTGSSGGPHLHFEIRDTRTQNTINPLHYFSIDDTVPPEIKTIQVFGIDSLGRVYETNRLSHFSGDTCYTPYTNIGIATHIVDRMNNSANKLGVYRLSIWAGGKEIYNFTLDKSSFAQGKYINDVKYYEDYRIGKTTYKCFGNKQNNVIGLNNRDNGVITLAKDSVVEMLVKAMDINGNTTEIKFFIAQEGVLEPLKYNALIAGKSHTLRADSVQIVLPTNALFSTIVNEFSVNVDSITGYPEIKVATRPIPLFEKAELTIHGQYPQTSVICEKTSTGKSIALSTQNKNKQLKATIGSLSTYIIRQDTLAPTIKYLGVSNQKLKFKIDDNLTGIKSYRGEVNGKWTLFVYDAKNKLLSCQLSEPAFNLDVTNKVVILVQDKVGNKAKKEMVYGKK